MSKSAKSNIVTASVGINGFDNLPADTALDNVDANTSYYAFKGSTGGATLTFDHYDGPGNVRTGRSLTLAEGEWEYVGTARNVSVSAGILRAYRVNPFDVSG